MKRCNLEAGGCGRSEQEGAVLRDGSALCGACEESIAEAKADDAAKLAEARRLVRAADRKLKLGRCECCVGDTPHVGAAVHKRPRSRCTRTATAQLRKAADRTLGGKPIAAGPWSSYCEPCAAAIEAYQSNIVERRPAEEVA